MNEITLHQIISEIGAQTSVLILTALAAFAIIRQSMSERHIDARIKERSDSLAISVEKNRIETENKALERERILSERLITLTEKHGELQALNASMKAELVAATARLNSAAEATRALEVKIVALQQGHVENERKIASMISAAEALSKERDILQKDNQAKAERISELEKRVSSLELDNARLKETLKALKDNSEPTLKMTDKID